MAYLSWKNRLRFPIYKNRNYETLPVVNINEEKCNGCGLCTSHCLYSALYLSGTGKDKKAMMHSDAYCCSCNKCSVVCPQKAIGVKTYYDFGGKYTVLQNGPMKPPRRFLAE